MTKHEFQTPTVYEVPPHRERLDHDTFGDFNTPQEPLKVEAGRPLAMAVGPPMNYEAQLEFHKYEVSQAEQRGFPEGQLNYHLGKIACLEALADNVIEVDFYERRRA